MSVTTCDRCGGSNPECYATPKGRSVCKACCKQLEISTCDICQDLAHDGEQYLIDNPPRVYACQQCMLKRITFLYDVVFLGKALTPDEYIQLDVLVRFTAENKHWLKDMQSVEDLAQ